MRAGGSRPLTPGSASSGDAARIVPRPSGATVGPVPLSRGADPVPPFPGAARPPASPVDDPRPLLYAVVCGSPPARHVDRLVRLAQRAGWQVAVVATPSARAFIDEPALEAQTGYPVRHEFHQPGDPLRSRTADAIVVAPATVNTVNKWAQGIADSLALALVVEGQGLGLPIVAMPFTNSAMASHPAFLESLGRLRSWGVRVLFGDDVMVMPAPGTGARYASRFPWQLPLEALGPPRPALRAVPPPAGTAAPAGGTWAPGAASATGGPAAGRVPATGGAVAAPPRAPRPAPALTRRR
jgi:hypothetical protein